MLLHYVSYIIPHKYDNYGAFLENQISFFLLRRRQKFGKHKHKNTLKTCQSLDS